MVSGGRGPIIALMIKNLNWAGPILMAGVLVVGVVASYRAAHSDPAPRKLGSCTTVPETVLAISADPMLTRHPAGTGLGEVAEGMLTCNGGTGTGGLEALAAAEVGARLSGSLPEAAVRAFYADLAQQSGWRADERPTGLFSATKPTGDCPWWFVLSSTRDRGYRVQVYYQPAGAYAASCGWADGDAILLPLGGGN